jgi:glyoxylase-like metal-dependent hydrolase (beta-lactamase superfamily II)
MSAAMKVQVEAQPLHEPLAGGTPGATVVVEPLIAGHVDFPQAMMVSPGGRFLTLKLLRALLGSRPPNVIPVPAFLIRHPSAGAILVDTGLHPSVATDGKENFGGLGNRIGGPTLEAGEDAPAQLRKRGLDPGEIPVVVMTHLHSDHSSAISEFSNSTFVISESEWKDAATGPRPTLNGYRRQHFDYAFDYRTIDFDRAGIDSYASFGRTFDLFGDGSIHLAFTPGHSAGHMSVICRLKQDDFVIGGDAMYMAAQLDGDAAMPPRPFDAHNLRRSLQELRLFHSQFPGATITPGHDPDFYAQLAALYE